MTGGDWANSQRGYADRSERGGRPGSSLGQWHAHWSEKGGLAGSSGGGGKERWLSTWLGKERDAEMVGDAAVVPSGKGMGAFAKDVLRPGRMLGGRGGKAVNP